MAISVRVDASQFDGLKKAFETIPKTHLRVTARALNDVARRVRTQFIREMQKVKNLKSQRGIRKATVIRRATAKRPIAKVIFTGRRIPLIDFGGRWLSGAAAARFRSLPNVERKKFKGATYQIEKEGRRKEVKRGFIATFENKKRGIVKRKKIGNRLAHQTIGPILLGPSVPQIVEDLPTGPQLLSQLETFAALLLTDRLAFHIEDEIDKAVKKGKKVS